MNSIYALVCVEYAIQMVHRFIIDEVLLQSDDVDGFIGDICVDCVNFTGLDGIKRRVFPLKKTNNLFIQYSYIPNRIITIYMFYLNVCTNVLYVFVFSRLNKNVKWPPNLMRVFRNQISNIVLFFLSIKKEIS